MAQSASSRLVSVIVPIYKTEEYLRECIDSILAQTYSNLEIILVDDGSPDSCPIICDEYEVSDKRIRVIHLKNGGVSNARNMGISIATGEWITFVDSDDIIAPQMIEELVNASKGEDSVSAVGFSRFKAGELPTPETEGLAVECSDIRAFTRSRGGMFSCGVLYNRRLIEQLQLCFDPGIGNLEDVVWNGMYLSHVNRFRYVPSGLYYYRQNPTSATNRCTDRYRQVSSWFCARSKAINWYAGKTLSSNHITTLRFLYRYCCNNILAECDVGQIRYDDFELLRARYPLCNIPDIRIIPTLFIEKAFPRLFFAAYLSLLRCRNWIKSR